MASPRTAMVFACALGAVLPVPRAVMASVAQAPPPATDRIVLGGDVDVPRGTQAGEIVVVSGDVTIGGVARGDVVVLSGDVVVTGHVSGDVIAIDGQVTVGPDAQILGGVLSRGRVAIDRGAKIDGEVRERTAFTWRSPVDVFGRFASWLAVSVSTLLLGLALVLLAPRGLDALRSVVRSSPVLAAAWSLAIVVAVPVGVLLLAASLVGLPLGVVVLLGLSLMLFAGYAGSAYALGRAIWAEPRNRAVAFVIGWSILRAVAAVPLLGGVTFALAGLFGLGSATVATWRTRDIGGRHRERRERGTTIRLDDVVREEAGL